MPEISTIGAQPPRSPLDGGAPDAPPAPPVALASERYSPGPRRVVSSLWLAVMFSYLYCDVLSFYDRETITSITSGELAMSAGALMAAALLMTVPITMTLVTRVAPHRPARISSIVAGAFMAVVQLGTLGVGTPPTVYYLYFSALEVAATVAIVWYAARRWSVDR